VVVVDHVLATGEILCAVLKLLKEAGVDAENNQRAYIFYQEQLTFMHESEAGC
jgi:uracil phosphoribosyltransferase